MKIANFILHIEIQMRYLELPVYFFVKIYSLKKAKFAKNKIPSTITFAVTTEIPKFSTADI